jgi:hypothetical protein
VSPYKVMVDDNYHYMDESERYELGIFSTVEEAIAACKRIVDEFLDKSYEPGMSAETLEKAYQGFGEDPFIIALGESSDKSIKFSAWTYAKERSQKLAAKDNASD